MENTPMSIDNRKPTILVLGATGQTGRLIVEELDHDPGGVQVRLAARRPEQVERLKAEGRDAVLLDLDDPRSFGQALAGVDRLFPADRLHGRHARAEQDNRRCGGQGRGAARRPPGDLRELGLHRPALRLAPAGRARTSRAAGWPGPTFTRTRSWSCSPT